MEKTRTQCGPLSRSLLLSFVPRQQSTGERGGGGLGPCPPPLEKTASLLKPRPCSLCQKGGLWWGGGRAFSLFIRSSHVLTELGGDLSLSISLLGFRSHFCFKEIESMCVWINCLTPKNVVLQERLEVQVSLRPFHRAPAGELSEVSQASQRCARSWTGLPGN